MATSSIPLPTTEQEARAKWDLLLSDIELRAEQVRHLKATPPSIEVLKLAASALTAGVALIGGIGGATVWLLHILGYIR
jgi:hypothetical protein